VIYLWNHGLAFQSLEKIDLYVIRVYKSIIIMSRESENYQALLDLPIVRQLIKKNKELRRKVKTLETLLYEFPALFEERKRNTLVGINTETNIEPTLCDTLTDDEVVFVPKPSSQINQETIDLTDDEEVLSDRPNVFIKIEKDSGVQQTEKVSVEEEETEEEAEEEAESEEAEEAEAESEEEAKPTEEDTEVFEITIKGKAYYTNNETSGNIYSILDDEDVGPVVGQFVNGKAKFNKAA
jgi:hypothetical protein